MRQIGIALLVGLGIAVSSASAQVIDEYEEPQVTELDGQDLYRARFVLRRFFRTERHPECYRILFSDFEGNLRVDFVPKNRGPIVVEEGEELPAVEEPCGDNVGYVLDRRGRILRRIYSR